MLALIGLALAQSLPSPRVAPAWETVETKHYRMHYPTEAQSWALEAAKYLEPIRLAVQEEVGSPMPERKVDILVQDPFSMPNGFALPLQRSPRMGVFATPPGADSVLGNYRSWPELLIVHEDTHLVHLLTPSRNPFFAALQRSIWPMGPVALKSPRWVSEGYATVVEGRLTGSGRPSSDGRATLLRALALEGRMPTYDELDGADRFMGGSMAYLVGSAYLEWLEQGRHPGALQELWRAMSAVEVRSFDEAFSMVFGDSAADLYARYLAELGHNALRVEELRPVSETLWQDLSGATGAPVVSPDGAHIAVLVIKDGRPVLQVLPTADNTQAEQDYKEALMETLERDPLDVTPLLEAPLHREPAYERFHGSVLPSEPAWMPDAQGLLFSAWQVDHDGRMRPDLFLWQLEGGERRITHGASVHSADVHPGGEWAVAVQERWAVSQLVRVELETGAISVLSEGDALTVHDDPRFSPSGDRIAFLRHTGAWELVLLEAGLERVIELPPGAQISGPEWLDEDTLVASLGQGGFVEAWAIPLSGPSRRLTQTRGGALNPTPDGDGGLYFCSLSAEGLALHHDAGALWADRGAESYPVEMVLRPQAQVDPWTPKAEQVQAHRYRLGPQSVRPLVGASTLPNGGGFYELGLRVGDPAGRSTVHAMALRQDVQGGALGWTLRVLPVDLGLWAWTFQESQGAALFVQDDWIWSNGQASAGLSAMVDSQDNAGAAWSSVSHRLWWGRSWVQGSLNGAGKVQLNPAGASPGGQGELSVATGWRGFGVYGSYGQAASLGAATLHLGGLPSSAYAPGWDSLMIYDPALGMEGTQTRGAQSWSASLGSELLYLQTRWHYAEQTEGTDRIGSVGLSVQADTPAQPFMRVSPSHLRVGVACVVDPVGPKAETKPCTTRESYGAWLALSWTP